MSDFVGAVAALRTALEAGFAALPLRWPNDDRPATLDVAPNGFVYSEARLTDEGPAEIGPDGARTHRDTGTFDVFIYVPRGTLAGAAEAHAETIRGLFKSRDVPGVVVTRRRIGAGSVVEGPNGHYWCVPVFIEWFSDRIE